MANVDEPPLLPSQGVGTGGAGHVCSGSRSVFRLPPPIPGKPGGGYPSEWHDAQNTIRRNWLGHVARKHARGETLQEVTLNAAAAGGIEGTGERMRKRDMLMKWVGDATSSISQVADQVYKKEAVQKTAASVTGAVAAAGARVNEIKATVSTKAVQVGELAAERKTKYAGWMMAKVGTPAIGAAAAVGFYLAKQREGRESAFDVARKQERVEVVDISARNSIKTSIIVKPGDTLNWTFAIRSLDLMFHVKLRKMMDVGGSEEEDLVPSIKVDASSIAEGTWTCAKEGQGGQVVLCWDNTRSLLRSKTIAYRTWLVRGDAKQPTGQSLDKVAAPHVALDAPASSNGGKAEVVQDSAAAQDNEQQRRQDEEEAARKASEAQEAAEKAAKLEAEALAQKQAEEKKLEEEEAARKAAEAQEAAEKAAKLEAEALAQKQAEEKKLEEEEAARKAAEAQEAAEKAAKLEAEALAQKQAEEKKLEEEEAARKAAEAQEAAEKAAKLEAEALALQQAEEKKLEEEEAQAKAEEEKAAEFFQTGGEEVEGEEGDEGVDEGQGGEEGAGGAGASASKKKKKKKK